MSSFSTAPYQSIHPMYEAAEPFMLISLALAVCALAFRWWLNRRFPEAEEVVGGLPHYVATRGADERIMADIVAYPDAETPAEWAARHQAEGWTVRKIGEGMAS